MPVVCLFITFCYMLESTLLRRMKINFSDHKIGTQGINTPFYTNVIDFHIVV